MLHNLEEGALIGLWQPRAGRWRHPVSPGAFRFAVAVVTVEGLALVETSRRAPAKSRRRGLASGLAVLLLGNVAAPHLAATLARRRYSPGVVTAVAVNLPVSVGVVRHGARNGWFDRAAVKASSALVVGGVVAQLPVLFAVGKRLAR